MSIVSLNESTLEKSVFSITSLILTSNPASTDSALSTSLAIDVVKFKICVSVVSLYASNESDKLFTAATLSATSVSIAVFTILNSLEVEITWEFKSLAITLSAFCKVVT